MNRGENSPLRKTEFIICALIATLTVAVCVFVVTRRFWDSYRLNLQMERLRETEARVTESPLFSMPPGDALAVETADEAITILPEILPAYQELYSENSDLIGWLKINDTVIDYPVMQTPEDEEYYLYRGFDKSKNSNGSLIMDTDSVVGIGTAEHGYQDGEEPSTNLIIHGHTMKSGAMFGNLQRYADADYTANHNIIQFDSLYEHREYEVIAAFYSQVYYAYEDVFKFYKFFQADTQEEFDDWYENIKALSLFDTGVTAEFGDTFITLSCCSYQVDDGRFVVVGKRIN